MKVSIIITTYNYDIYVARAIRSCIQQSFPKSDFEIIVVNDSSKDSTKYILASYGNWIRVIENEKNMGLPYSRNQGIRNARGEYIVNLDADDFLHADFINICHLYMTFNKFDAVASDYFLIDQKEEIIGREDCLKRPIACGIMFRRKQMIELGMYDESLSVAEDLDFRARFDKKYNIHRINLPLYRYRMHKNNLTRDQEKNLEYIEIVARNNGITLDHSYQPAEIAKERKA